MKRRTFLKGFGLVFMPGIPLVWNAKSMGSIHVKCLGYHFACDLSGNKYKVLGFRLRYERPDPKRGMLTALCNLDAEILDAVPSRERMKFIEGELRPYYEAMRIKKS